MSDDDAVISVEIHGQRYPIRSTLDQEYVTRLASYVDEKMRAAAVSMPTGDLLRLAVLTALNVADELFRCRESVSSIVSSWRRTGKWRRTLNLEPRTARIGPRVLGPCVVCDGGWLVEPMFTQVSREPAWCACLCNEEA